MEFVGGRAPRGGRWGRSRAQQAGTILRIQDLVVLVPGARQLSHRAFSWSGAGHFPHVGIRDGYLALGSQEGSPWDR